MEAWLTNSGAALAAPAPPAPAALVSQYVNNTWHLLTSFPGSPFLFWVGGEREPGDEARYLHNVGYKSLTTKVGQLVSIDLKSWFTVEKVNEGINFAGLIFTCSLTASNRLTHLS